MPGGPCESGPPVGSFLLPLALCLHTNPSRRSLPTPLPAGVSANPVSIHYSWSCFEACTAATLFPKASLAQGCKQLLLLSFPHHSESCCTVITLSLVPCYLRLATVAPSPLHRHILLVLWLTGT